MKNILVIGFSTRNIVFSGSRAGYNMYAIDAFCDYDLQQCAKAFSKLDIGESFDASKISLNEVTELIEGFGVDFDAIIPGSGFETIGLERLPYWILGNDPRIMSEVSDKHLFSIFLKKRRIAHPETVLLHDIGMLEFPVMVKPACSGGGIFNMKVESPEDLLQLGNKLKEAGMPPGKSKIIAQEFVEGIPASVSVLSTKDRAVAIAVNEQLIGTTWLTGMPFAYCGNITPFENPYASEMKLIAENLILELGLVGSNGIDFIITESGPVVIEVNARFQGSLDSVEMATDINLLDSHLKAFEGIIDVPAEIESEKENGSANKYAGRCILYSDRKMVMTEAVRDMLLEMNVCDVPVTGQVIGPYEPIISVLCSGNDREEVICGMKDSVMFIRESLNLLES
ncbi:ATP-grasp domain-containing protein [Methanolobus vulcani]|uniref:ATP-grasp domain-containing protein n=1 Tax=Methanolobus vulcani TaxID=38026 RepID=A0A7Z8KMR8_9EURY|nr:ATP-grasp domain-containing protein [Methanolobus vulcani]TQD23449.1 ATP-grasp domain-containing protein [Methanolobus vulcani]